MRLTSGVDPARVRGVSAEAGRILARDQGREAWSLWGPYLSDRQWGTVREDYSADGDAWAYFPHDHARSRAYRWGEDGILGLCDEECRVCFAPAFWNGRDSILKERLFGLSNPQGNHGEDIKEYFYYLDNTPTHSLMRGLYKYPQAAFPYDQLVAENGRRSRLEPEYELVDTGIFNEGRYFDIFVEYAKVGPEDIAIRIRAINRGPESAPLTLLPTLWFRNTWSWGGESKRPGMRLQGEGVIAVAPEGMPGHHLYCGAPDEILFTENETNFERLFQTPNTSPCVKDAFHDYLIHQKKEAVNPARRGTKAAAVWRRVIAPGEEFVIRLRLSREPQEDPLGEDFDAIFVQRQEEADAFFRELNPGLGSEEALIQRRALAGLLWSKKFYCYPVMRWLEGDPDRPAPPAERWRGRNAFWKELHARDIIAMPDPWEYPYFCAWDLMFHSVAFAVMDAKTAQIQSMILRGERYTAPSAQMPAYEWALSDANPPIHGWATWRVYSMGRARTGQGDRAYLKRAFNKLLLNYGWWANRVDQAGDNVFEGGFLGLDNIGVFDRRYPLPDGSRIKQSDGTAWMATFCLNMLNIAVELAKEEPAYEDIADRFLSDFFFLAGAINGKGSGVYSLWDEEDGFYYDALMRPDGATEFLKTRSIAGLTPLFAVESFNVEAASHFPILRKRIQWLAKNRSCLLDHLDHVGSPNQGRLLVSLVPPERLRRICARLFDEEEFLSPHGIRSLSKTYEKHPYTLTAGGRTETLAYSPGDSPVAMFGGNSNWRGPVWIPMNFLLIEALQKFGFYFGDSFRVEYPTGSGRALTLWEISLDLQRRIVALFKRDPKGRRPFLGDVALFQEDPHWRDQFLFHEYFHADTGVGLGASHQTGWTALVAKMIQQLHAFRRDCPSA